MKRYMFLPAETIFNDLPRKILSKARADKLIASGFHTLGDLACAYEVYKAQEKDWFSDPGWRQKNLIMLLLWERAPNLISDGLVRDWEEQTAREEEQFQKSGGEDLISSEKALFRTFPKKDEIDRERVLSELPSSTLSKLGSGKLKVAGIHTFGDLLDVVALSPYYEIRFLRMPGVGRKTLKQLTALILQHGFGFAHKVVARTVTLRFGRGSIFD